MFSINPFVELSNSIPVIAMQAFVILMFVLVAGGTIYDMIEKQNATYFFRNWRKAKLSKIREVSFGDMLVIIFKTITVDVFSAAEFCSFSRRLAHLLTFYGFIGYVITTIVMVIFSFRLYQCLTVSFLFGYLNIRALRAHHSGLRPIIWAFSPITL